KLSEICQNVFSMADKTNVYAVNNKWGKQGWTLIALQNVQEDLFAEALTVAFCEVAPKKLAELVRRTSNEK
nr:hypothetical protein [Chitinophagales bacterium]